MMFKRKRIQNVLAYWRVDPSTWRDFVRELRLYQQQPHAPYYALKLDREPPPSGVEIVITDHAVSVGSQSFDLIYTSLRVTLRDSWLEFEADLGEGQSYLFPVPVPGDARAEAARVAHYFEEQGAEEARARAEARARPTPANHLLNFVEGHFALAMAIFFFVLLPALVFVLCLISQWFPSFRLMRDG